MSAQKREHSRLPSLEVFREENARPSENGASAPPRNGGGASATRPTRHTPANGATFLVGTGPVAFVETDETVANVDENLAGIRVCREALAAARAAARVEPSGAFDWPAYIRDGMKRDRP